MSASMNKRAVPWINRPEFVDVYTKLYSGKFQAEQEALNHITVWQTRCESVVPLAVTCSADLITAQIEYRLYHDGSVQHSSEYRLRQTLTLALIRFVNFITDRYQTDGSNVAIPIHRIGEEIGIPEWIVSLRHEGTHRALPTLDVLSRGADWATRWLKECFWEKQVPDLSDASWDGRTSSSVKGQRSKSAMKGMSRKPKSYKKIRFQAGESEFPVTPSDYMMEGEGVHKAARLLVAFQQIRFQELAGRTFRIGDLETGTEGQQVLVELKKLLSLNTEQTMDVLVQPGYIRPSVDQLSHMGLDSNRCSHDKIAWVLAIFWRPLLHKMNTLRVTSCLIERFASIITDSSSHWNRLTHIWMGMLVSPYIIAFPSGRSTSLFDHQVAVPELQLLQQCLKHPNIFTCDLLKAFASRVNALLTHTAVERLSELLQIYVKDEVTWNKTQRPDEKDAITDNRSKIDLAQVFSVQDILQGVPDAEASVRQPTSQWRLCSESTAWHHIPVGVLPGQELSALYHDLYLGGQVKGQRSTIEDSLASVMEEATEVEMEFTPSIVMDCKATETVEDSTNFRWSSDLLGIMQNKLVVL